MVWIVLGFLSTYQSSRSRTMVTISNVKAWHLLELFSHSLDVSFICDNPELMSESIIRCHEIILWFCSSITCQQRIQHLVVWISKEYWFNIGIADAHMLHAILFLISTCQFMLLDITLQIVINIRSNNKTILRLTVHRLRIDIVMLFIILYSPPLVLEHLELLNSTVVCSWVIFTCTNFKVDFRLDNMI